MTVSTARNKVTRKGKRFFSLAEVQEGDTNADMIENPAFWVDPDFGMILGE